MPSTVRSIGKWAFAQCGQLKDVALNEGLEEILQSAFNTCAIESIRCPSTVEHVDEWAFAACQQLKHVTLNEGLEAIPVGAFQYTGIESIRLPATVERVEHNAFTDETAPSDEGTEFSSNDTNISWQPTPPKDATVEYMGGMTEVRKDACKVRIDTSVKRIPAETFQNCKSLNQVEFREGLEEIGKRSFQNCVSLTSIRLPSTTRIIGKSAFYSCESLQVAIFCEGLIEIRKEAFSWCKSLEEVSLPSTVRYLGKLAFSNCQRLRSVALNDGLVEIGDLAFCNCDMLEKMQVPSSVKRIGREALPAANLKRVDQANKIDCGTPDRIKKEPSVGAAFSVDEQSTSSQKTSEETKRLRDDFRRDLDLTKQELQSCVSKLEGEVSSLRGRLMTTSDHDDEIQSLRAESKQADDRARMAKYEIESLRRELKEEVSKRDEEIKILREGRDEDRRKIKEFRKQFSTLQESVERFKRPPTVASVPTADRMIATGEHRAKKRPRLEENHDASTGVAFVSREDMKNLKDKMTDMMTDLFDSVIAERD